MTRRLLQIGERWFVSVGMRHFKGGAAEYLSRFLPFGLHRVDVQNMSSNDASWQLYQHLNSQGLEWKFLSVGIIEEGKEPTEEYSAELTNYLANLRDPDAVRMRGMALANLLKAMASEQNGTTFLQLMRNRDEGPKQ